MKIKPQVGALLLIAVLGVVYAACWPTSSPVQPEDTAAKPVSPEVLKWSAIIATVKAVGGRASISRSQSGESEDFIIAALPTDSSAHFGIMAAGPDSICETEDEGLDGMGLDGMETFAECAKKVDEADVCGNGGDSFHLEINPEEGSIHLHLHCPNK